MRSSSFQVIRDVCRGLHAFDVGRTKMIQDQYGLKGLFDALSAGGTFTLMWGVCLLVPFGLALCATIARGGGRVYRSVRMGLWVTTLASVGAAAYTIYWLSNVPGQGLAVAAALFSYPLMCAYGLPAVLTVSVAVCFFWQFKNSEHPAKN